MAIPHRNARDLSMRKTGLILDLTLMRHLTGAGHPERPERLAAIEQHLRECGLRNELQPLATRPATREELARVHTTAYLERVDADAAAGLDQLSTGDTPLTVESPALARLAAGGVLAATEAVVRREVANAFCAIRPPGHHASPGRGMGFCLYNNVALAARHAQAALGLERVAIVDWDVHHGNGTQDAFYAEGSVFFTSIHQHPWYPGTGLAEETGEGAGRGATLNLPLRAGSGGTEILRSLREKALPRLREFAPQLVIISAGFDSRAGDPLGGFMLSDEDFAEMTRELQALADATAEGRLLSVLEGGYSLSGLAAGVEAHVRALLAE